MRNTIELPFTFFRTKGIVQLVILFAGFVPVSCIALHVLEIASLHQTALFLALPAFSFILFFLLKNSTLRSVIIKGWVSGVIAVALYDAARVPFILAGWDDFIPRIGDWVLNNEGQHGLPGYLWRYIGNGGGMGIAFMVLMKNVLAKKAYLLKGILYGLFIFCCLMLSLILSPNGETLMFKITPFTFTGSLLGHLVYGFVLGKMGGYWLKNE